MEKTKIPPDNTAKSSANLRRSSTMPERNGTQQGGRLRHANSEDTNRKLDKFGFIVNMDSNGELHEDMSEERIPSFAEARREERRKKKWSSMMQSWDSTKRRRKLVLRWLRKGIPDPIRGKVWTLLGDVPRKIAIQHKGLYKLLVDKTSKEGNSAVPNEPAGAQWAEADASITRSLRNIQDTIERDIHRTYPRHSLFHEDDSEDDVDSEEDLLPSICDSSITDLIQELDETINSKNPKTEQPSPPKRLQDVKGGQAALRRVLRAYSYYDQEVGYCQGMNFIAGMFLTFMTEEEAFWLLVAVMKEQPCQMRGLFGEGMREAHKCLYIAEKLTHQFLPRLAKHLDKENVHVTMYATQWLLTQYTSSFPFELVTRVWDCFLGEGWKITYRVMLALLSQWQSQLMRMSFEEILNFFRELPERVDVSAVMDTALKIPLKRKHIAKYEKEWKARQ